MRAQRADNRSSPVAKWSFNGTLIASVGGYNWTVSAGTERYADVLPGLRGFYFDGSTVLTAVADAAMRIVGDMTFRFSGLIPRQPAGSGGITPTLLTVGLSGATGEANNQLYDYNTGADGGGVSIFHEHGDGVGVNRAFPDVVIANARPVRVAFVRTDNVYSVWVNGKLRGTASSATPPTGGGSAHLRFGSSGGGDPFLTACTIADASVDNRALTAEELARDYERTLGPILGCVL